MKADFRKSLDVSFDERGNTICGRYSIYLNIIEIMNAVHRQKPEIFFPIGLRLIGSETDFTYFARDYKLWASLLPNKTTFLALCTHHNIEVRIDQ